MLTKFYIKRTTVKTVVYVLCDIVNASNLHIICIHIEATKADMASDASTVEGEPSGRPNWPLGPLVGFPSVKNL